MTNGSKKLISVAALGACSLLEGCIRTPKTEEPKPEVRISLFSEGLPRNFFTPEAGRCASQIIGYRSVVWLNDHRLAVVFNTSPGCREIPDRQVQGAARVVAFDIQGSVKAVRDLPYLADGYGEVVADGEAMAGPDGTLLFRLQSVNLDSTGEHESKSGVRLLDTDLKDVVQIDKFLEKTTFVDHALVFQEGFTQRGPRTYSVVDGKPPTEVKQWQINWPAGTMDRTVGQHSYAFMLCEQELRPNVYSSTNVVFSGANRRCTMNEQTDHGSSWQAALHDNQTAALIGTLADGSVVGQVNQKGSTTRKLLVWREGGGVTSLPWLPANYSGSVQSGTADMSRYAVSASREDPWVCRTLGYFCSEGRRWFVFDRNSQGPLVERDLAQNARAALSPDGLHYATFESGELRIYSLLSQNGSNAH